MNETIGRLKPDIFATAVLATVRERMPIHWTGFSPFGLLKQSAADVSRPRDTHWNREHLFFPCVLFFWRHGSGPPFFTIFLPIWFEHR